LLHPWNKDKDFGFEPLPAFENFRTTGLYGLTPALPGITSDYADKSR
jgi:hypothetical protein